MCGVMCCGGGVGRCDVMDRVRLGATRTAPVSRMSRSQSWAPTAAVLPSPLSPLSPRRPSA